MFRFRFQYQDSASERDKRKRRRLLGRLQDVCPHIVAMDPTQHEEGKTGFAVHYAFETFVGTLDYVCMLCGSCRSEHAVQVHNDRMSRAFHNDPHGTMENIVQDKRKASKLLRRLNRLGGAP